MTIRSKSYLSQGVGKKSKEINYGYERTVFPTVHGLIEEWESMQVVKLIASGNYGSRIKLY